MPVEQVLRIEPEHELRFKGPFTSATTSVLKLGNPSERRVCFKIKTTAPKRYCVRPNAGILEPGQNINIAVVFQPCELEPTATKHKFMVQSLFAPDGEFNMDTLWKDMDPTKLMDSKLRCAFDFPSGGDGSGSGVPASSHGESNDMNNAAREERSSKAAEDHKYNKQKIVHEERGSRSSGGDPEILHSLKQENGHLKDEIEKLRRALKTRTSEGGGSGFGQHSSSMYDRQQSSSTAAATAPAIPMIYLVIAIACIIFGLILGKFFV